MSPDASDPFHHRPERGPLPEVDVTYETTAHRALHRLGGEGTVGWHRVDPQGSIVQRNGRVFTQPVDS